MRSRWSAIRKSPFRRRCMAPATCSWRPLPPRCWPASPGRGRARRGAAGHRGAGAHARAGLGRAGGGIVATRPARLRWRTGRVEPPAAAGLRARWTGPRGTASPRAGCSQQRLAIAVEILQGAGSRSCSARCAATARRNPAAWCGGAGRPGGMALITAPLSWAQRSCRRGRHSRRSPSSRWPRRSTPSPWARRSACCRCQGGSGSAVRYSRR